MTNIYEFESYKEFLRIWVENPACGGKGAKIRLAKAAGCNPSFVSQVLLGFQNFNLEQAERITGHLGLTEEATRFFLLLIQSERAGSQSLKEIFNKQIRETKDRQSELKNRLQYAKVVPPEAQAT